VAVADGDRVGDGARLTITQGEATVEYVVLSGSAWVRPLDGDWEQVDAAAAGTDPIAALRAAIDVTSIDGGFVVGVPAAALGVPHGGDAEVAVDVTGGAVTAVRYSTTVDGHPAAVEMRVGPAVDPSPVVAPT
jgi:hypothetical protein